MVDISERILDTGGISILSGIIGVSSFGKQGLKLCWSSDKERRESRMKRKGPMFVINEAIHSGGKYCSAFLMSVSKIKITVGCISDCVIQIRNF
jgi:hypothetical protein